MTPKSVALCALLCLLQHVLLIQLDHGVDMVFLIGQILQNALGHNQRGHDTLHICIVVVLNGGIVKVPIR